jgi:hypothetical protein
LNDHEQRRIARVTYNRRFFIAKQTTHEGEEQLFMGLGPETLEDGDVIVVLSRWTSAICDPALDILVF